MLANQKGGAAVEFAIALPLLAMILFGTIDFAMLFYNKQVLTNASREGARSAIVEDNRNPLTGYPTPQENIIIDYCLNNLINIGGYSLVVNTPVIDDTSFGGDYIIATVTYDYVHLYGSLDFLTAALGITKTTTITGQTVMRKE